MNIKYYLKKVPGLSIPKRANITDAGYDVVATSDPKIVGSGTQSSDGVGRWFTIDYVEYETNLYFVPEDATTPSTKFSGALDVHHIHTDLRPRSSISSKTNFVLANSVGLIDRGYHNQVLVRFKYIWQPTDLQISTGFVCGRPSTDRMYKKGDAIAQLLPMVTHDINFELVDNLPGDDRGGGFGSTDVKKVVAQSKPVTPTISKPSPGFRLGTKTTVSQYFSQMSRYSNTPAVIDEVTAEEYLRKNDGDIYSYTLEYSLGKTYGLCVVDGSGQVLDMVQVY